MTDHSRVRHPIYNLLPTEIEGFSSLADLALDMRWSWNHATDKVWRQLDPDLWEVTHNPWVVLQTLSRDQIESVLSDPVFRKEVDDMMATNRDAMTRPAWFQRNHCTPESPPALTVSNRPSLNSTLAAMPSRSSELNFTICWRWAARIRTTRERASIWLTWRSVAAGQLTA